MNNISSILLNNSLEPFCESKRQFESFFDFLECYKYFAFNNLEITIYCLFVIFGALVLNIMAIYLLSTKTTVNSVFDKIFIGHAFVDLLTGFIDFPFLYFMSIFNYWPFSKNFCIYYAAFDNILATVEVFHILFMSWARIRCILSPKNYSNELIIKYCYSFIVILWIICSILWIPVSAVFINKNYQDYTCYLSFDSAFVSILIILLGWIAPVIIAMLSTTYIVYVLRKRNRKKMSLMGNKVTVSGVSHSNEIKVSFWAKIKLAKLNPQTKLSIIITPFCLQYLQYSIVWLVSMICAECVSTRFYTFSYFIAFLTSFTNPLILLLINPDYFFKRIK